MACLVAIFLATAMQAQAQFSIREEVINDATVGWRDLDVVGRHTGMLAD